MISKKNIIVFLLCFAGSFSNAQQAANKAAESSYRAVHWTIYDGLSQAEDYFILKDVNGFVWIGTKNGLNRFDGNLIKNYYHDPHNKNTIAGNYITSLNEDSLHNIWIGSDIGLSRYDIKADTFLNFYVSKNTINKGITAFAATKDIVYALESGSRITAYNVHSFQKKTLANLNITDSVDYGPSGKYSIYDPASNSVWILFYSSGEAGLLNVSLSNGIEKRYTWDCYLKIPHHHHASEAMVYDKKRNSLWINSPDGLMEFTLADKQFHHIDALNQLLKLKDYYRFVGIDMDQQGRVWFATNPKGLLIYDPANNSISTPFPKDSIMQHDISDANAVIYCDRGGIIWLGTWLRKGFYQLIPSSPAVKLYTPEPKQGFGFNSNSVISITKPAPKKLWVATLGGLYLFDTKADKLFALNEKDFPGLKTSRNGSRGNDVILPDIIDFASNNAIVETTAGPFKMDLQTKQCAPIIFKDSSGKPIENAPVESQFILRFKGGWILVRPSGSKEGIFIGNTKNATAQEAFSFPANDIDLYYTATDEDHLLFVKRNELVGNITFSYHNGKWSQMHHKLDSIQWTSIFFNKKDKTYWVAAENKLMHFNKDFRSIRIYKQADGLPNLEIVGLIADNNGNIWFHTDRSIHQLNVETGEISKLSEMDGFEKQDFELIKFNYKDDNGDIYFPGGGFGKGFNRIIPGKFTNPPSSIYLQSLEINQKPFPLATGINSLHELSLRYFENKITIETGIIDYYSKGTSHMRYKLEGKDLNESWQYGPANYTIRFEGLLPGTYKLRMQASNAALQFNGPEKVLAIIISPPWWQTWWAWVIYAVLFVTAIYAFIAYRSRTLIREKHLLEENVAVRTKQLSEANKELSEKQEEITTQRDQLSVTLTDLKATQKQLIQSEKMASLGELTAGIAHEIQNPLNFVNNFSEVSKEMIGEMKEDIDKGDIDEIKLIATDIEQNLEKIIHHGKRADAIVKGMLQHSRISTGLKELTDINALADEYMRLAYHGLRAKDNTFTAAMNTDFDNKIGKINIITQDIGRVFLNLFNNAFYAVTEKAKTAGNSYHPAVTVNTKRKDNKVIITVSDNGNGIPQSIVDKIYQPFFTTKPTGQGTGLGLSLSYDIIKAHGGEIKVESKEGEGTEFIITLPG